MMNIDLHNLLTTENLHRKIPFRDLKIELWEDRYTLSTVIRVYDSKGKMLINHRNKTPSYAKEDPYHVKVRDCLDNYLLQKPLLRTDPSQDKFSPIRTSIGEQT